MASGRQTRETLHFQEVLKLDPDFDQAHYRLSDAYELRGMYPEAITELQKMKSPDASRYVNGRLGHTLIGLLGKEVLLEVLSVLHATARQFFTFSFSAAGTTGLASSGFPRSTSVL